jgi:hypothetical protein
MPHFQPSPMVVIRNQLLAFLVLYLLGSCTPSKDLHLAKPVNLECSSSAEQVIHPQNGWIKDKGST